MYLFSEDSPEDCARPKEKQQLVKIQECQDDREVKGILRVTVKENTGVEGV